MADHEQDAAGGPATLAISDHLDQAQVANLRGSRAAADRARRWRPVTLVVNVLSYLILPVAIVLGWWWYAVRNPAQLSSPGAVAEQLWNWIVHGQLGLGSYYQATWWVTVWASLVRVLIGFAVAAVSGVLIGTLIGLLRPAARIVDPTIQLFRPIPMTAWLPLSIVFFGLTDTASIFLIALGAFYPVVVNTTTGVRRVDIGLIRAAQVLGAKKWEVVTRIVFPAALPSVFDGLRVALGLSWMLVILAEMFAVKTGLGFVLWDAFGIQQTATMMGAMISIGVIGFCCDRLLIWARRHLLRWSVGRMVGV
jgi:NitT/TauT family transport system permease protein